LGFVKNTPGCILTINQLQSQPMNTLPTSPFIIGVAGGSGSGKSTVVANLLKMIAPPEAGQKIMHDNYYRDQSHLPLPERPLTNYDHPDSLETELLIEHLKQLKNGQPVTIPVYDFVHHTRSTESVTVNPAKVIIVEGILIFDSPELRNLLSLKVYVDTDADIRFIRRMRRDVAERGRTVESVIEQYETTVRPMHLEFVEPSKRYADIIIPEGGENTMALELLRAKVAEVIG
jgi:uridine kinase